MPYVLLLFHIATWLYRFRNCDSVDSILISLHYIPVDCQPTTCRLHLSTLKLPSTSLKTASYLKNTSRTLCPKVVHKIVSKLSFFIDSCSKQFMGAMADPRVYIRNVMFEVEKWHLWNMLTEHWGLPDPRNVYLCKKGKWREGKMCSVFLTYKTMDECRTVIQHLNGQYFCSAIPVEVALADPPPGKGPSTENSAPSTTSPEELRVVAPRPGRPSASEQQCLGCCISNLCFWTYHVVIAEFSFC